MDYQLAALILAPVYLGLGWIVIRCEAIHKQVHGHLRDHAQVSFK